MASTGPYAKPLHHVSDTRVDKPT